MDVGKDCTGGGSGIGNVVDAVVEGGTELYSCIKSPRGVVEAIEGTPNGTTNSIDGSSFPDDGRRGPDDAKFLGGESKSISARTGN